MDVLIKGARVVDFCRDYTGDVYIKNGIICSTGENLSADCRVVDGEGLVLLPAFIDMHSHFRDPGYKYKEDILSGSLAAVKGGYTAVNLMANTKPVASSMDIVRYVIKKSKDIGLLDVHQTVSITDNFDGRSLDHLSRITPSVRFISDDGRGVEDAGVMYRAMMIAKKMGLVVISHAEYKDIASADSRLSENLMTKRDVYLSEYTGCRLHVAHVSTKESMEEIIRAKRKGARVTCEVTPHHLALTEEASYSVNPSLRSREDTEFLADALKKGFVDAISTDHAPHSASDKMSGAPGISGLETSFAVCYTRLVQGGYISLNKLSEVMSKNPGEIMGLNKGIVDKGYDGDIVLVDTKEPYRISSNEFASKGKNTPFDGMQVTGRIVLTIKGGKIVYDGRDTNGCNRQVI